MYTTFVIDIISLLLLAGAFFLLWKDRTRFYSMRPLLPATAFLALAHMCDILVEHPSIRVSDYLGFVPGTLEHSIPAVANIADATGITFLVYGFIKIIKHTQSEEKHIQELERMLPLCSNCKKYRSEEGQWLPIEKYLIESGTPKLTHGICPECSALLYGGRLKKKRLGEEGG